MLASHQFRIKDKVFATLGWPEAGWAVIKLTPADQSRFLETCEGLSPEPGGRGKRGVTRARLAALDPDHLSLVLKAAWVQAGGQVADYA